MRTECKSLAYYKYCQNSNLRQIMNPNQKDNPRLQNPNPSQQKFNANDSDEFVYDSDHERYIGERTGIPIRRINPKENFDGFPRFSEYESWGGRDSNTYTSSFEKNQPFHHPQNQSKQNNIKYVANSHNPNSEPYRQKFQQNNSEDSFVYDPAKQISSQSSSQQVESRRKSSRLPDPFQQTFKNISSIKRKSEIQNNHRVSDVTSVDKLINDIKSDLDTNSFIFEELDALNQSNLEIDPHPEEKQQIEKAPTLQVVMEKKQILKKTDVGKKKSIGRVSFNLKAEVFEKSSHLNESNGHAQNHEKKQNSYDAFLEEFERRYKEEEAKKIKQEKQSEERLERKKKLSKQRQKERKSKLMEAFQFNEEHDKESLIKISHKKFQEDENEKQYLDHKKVIKKQTEKRQIPVKRDIHFQEDRSNSRNKSSKSKEQENKSKNKNKKKKEDKSNDDMKRNNKKNSKKEGKRSYNWRNKKTDTDLSEKQKKKQSKSSHKASYPLKKSPQKSKKKTGKRQKILQSSQQKSIAHKIDKKTKIRKVEHDDFFEKITSQLTNEEESDGRYPKRCRMKPTNYWQNQKVHYDTKGKIISIDHSSSNFLSLIRSNVSFPTTTKINFQQNLIQAKVYLPAYQILSSRGYEEPYTYLSIQLSSSCQNCNQVVIDDGIFTKELKSDQFYQVDPNRVFTIENSSNKTVTLIMVLGMEKNDEDK